MINGLTRFDHGSLLVRLRQLFVTLIAIRLGLVCASLARVHVSPAPHLRNLSVVLLAAMLCSACGATQGTVAAACPENLLPSAAAGPAVEPVDQVIAKLHVALSDQRYAKQRTISAGVRRLAPLGWLLEEQVNAAADTVYAFPDRKRVTTASEDAVYIGETKYAESPLGSGKWTISSGEYSGASALGVSSQVTVDNTIFKGTNPCGLFRLGTAPCADGTCHLLERDMAEKNYGPKGEWELGGHRSTLIVSQQTLLPRERDELVRYPDGKTYTSHQSYYDWGVPNVIEAPIVADCRRFDYGFVKGHGPGCEPTPGSVK